MYLESINNSYSANRVKDSSATDEKEVNIASLAVTFALLDQLLKDLEDAQSSTIAQVHTFAENPERKVLSDNCNKIIAEVNAYFSAIGARKSNGRILAIKEQITQYLQGVNSPESMKLLRELQANNFAGMTN